MPRRALLPPRNGPAAAYEVCSAVGRWPTSTAHPPLCPSSQRSALPLCHNPRRGAVLAGGTAAKRVWVRDGRRDRSWGCWCAAAAALIRCLSMDQPEQQRRQRGRTIRRTARPRARAHPLSTGGVTPHEAPCGPTGLGKACPHPACYLQMRQHPPLPPHPGSVVLASPARGDATSAPRASLPG